MPPGAFDVEITFMAIIVRLVVGGALGHVAVGVLIGLAGAWAGSRLMARFAFQTSPTDPALYLGAASLLLVVAGVAVLTHTPGDTG